MSHIKYAGRISDPLDLTTKQYVDNRSGVTSVNGATGAVTIDELPEVTSADNDKILKVIDGEWKAGTNPGGTSVHNELSGRDATGAHPMGAITGLSDVLSGKVDDYSISITAPTAGNPRSIKFLTVDYNGTDSNNAIFITLKAIACHPNGTSYKFMEDITIGVSYVGDVGVDVQKSIRTTCGTVDGAERFYGDVFYTIDTNAKIVDFFILGGQYSEIQFTPYKRRNGVPGGTITQYSGTAAYYSSGTKVYGNNDLIATLSSIPTELSELDSDATHRLVTDTEKSTWNSKQNSLTPGDGLTIVNNTISLDLDNYDGGAF